MSGRDAPLRSITEVIAQLFEGVNLSPSDMTAALVLVAAAQHRRRKVQIENALERTAGTSTSMTETPDLADVAGWHCNPCRSPCPCTLYKLFSSNRSYAKQTLRTFHSFTFVLHSNYKDITSQIFYIDFYSIRKGAVVSWTGCVLCLLLTAELNTDRGVSDGQPVGNTLHNQELLDLTGTLGRLPF